MSAPPLTPREQELWVDRQRVLPEWTYPEALIWIAFRSVRDIGARLDFGRSPTTRDEPTLARETCRLIAREPGAVETEPAAALEVRLLSGEVKAFADFPDRSNGARRWLIRRDEWSRLTTRDDTGFPGPGTFVDPRDWRGPRSRSGVYVNVGFSVPDLLAAFPETDANASHVAVFGSSDGPYWDRARLEAAAVALARKGERLAVRGLARMMADAELGERPDRNARRKRIDAIRKNLDGKLDERDLDSLRAIMEREKREIP